MTYYVTMTDSFMSDWGKAKGLINKIVFICDTLEEVYYVHTMGTNREEMKQVRICDTKPKYLLMVNVAQGINSYAHGRYYVQIKTKQTHPNWYPRTA